MTSGKPKENGKTDIMDNTRKTLQFNERTDRSLNAELSQLERNRREIVRDLRKIKQIKSTLNEQLRTVLEQKARQRSVSDTSLYACGLKFPSVDRKVERPRFHSDIGPMDRLIANERCRLEKLGLRNETSTNALNEEEQMRVVKDGSVPKLKLQDDRHDNGVTEVYRTNQELRAEILIKSRFNQLGSRYVGKELNRLHRSSEKDKRRRVGAGQSVRTRSSTLAAQHKRNDAVAKEVIGDSADEISCKLSSLSVNTNALDENRNELGTSAPNKDTSSLTEHTISRKIAIRISPSSNDSAGKGGPDSPKLSPRLAAKSNISLSEKPNASGHSVGGLDIDSMKVKQEAILPIIPIELRSKRLKKAPNSLEHAFMVCRDVHAESKDLKNERKRRFANLVNLVVKQRKVINAWEPLMTKIGEIHSDDEV